MTRPLTPGEEALARGVFGDAIDYAPVRLSRRKWVFFQPRDVAMTPCGVLHFHPAGNLWREDFAAAPVDLQGLFIHELVHVWQHQQGIVLPIRRHPFCRYEYSLVPGRPFTRYGLEQQGEIVRHAFLLRQHRRVPGAPPLAQYDTLIPFRGA